MYCVHCGKEIKDDAVFCPYCGKDQNEMPGYTEETADNTQTNNNPYTQGNDDTYTQANTYTSQRPAATCPKCGGHNISYQTVTESKKPGCGTYLLYFLLIISCFGIVIFVMLMLRQKTVTVTYAVCQDCGYRWVVKKG